MKDIEKKALAACLQTVQAKAEIKRLTTEIGDALNQCPGVNGKIGLMNVDPFTLIVDASEDTTHLKAAYTPETCDDGCGGEERYYLSEDEIIEYLQPCPHCLAAHHLVQKRKVAKQALAKARRQITNIGKAAMVSV